MNNMNLKYGLVALMGLGLSANVSAADLTCDDVEFTPAAFSAYEYADKACMDIVDRDGGLFAKFTATKVVPPDLSPGVSNFIRFKHNDGTVGSRHKSNLPRNFQIYLGGNPVRMADVNEGQDMNIYVGQEFWVPLVVEEVVEEAIIEAIVEEAIVEEYIEEEMEEELPTTAGPLPWLALFGSLFLILGGALRFSRKQ